MIPILIGLHHFIIICDRPVNSSLPQRCAVLTLGIFEYVTLGGEKNFVDVIKLSNGRGQIFQDYSSGPNLVQGSIKRGKRKGVREKRD